MALRHKRGRDPRGVSETTRAGIRRGAVLAGWLVVTLRWEQAEAHWVDVVVGEPKGVDRRRWSVAREVLAHGGSSGPVSVAELERGTRLTIDAFGVGELFLMPGFVEMFLVQTTAVVPLGGERSPFDVSDRELAEAMRALGRQGER